MEVARFRSEPELLARLIRLRLGVSWYSHIILRGPSLLIARLQAWLHATERRAIPFALKRTGDTGEAI